MMLWRPSCLRSSWFCSRRAAGAIPLSPLNLREHSVSRWISTKPVPLVTHGQLLQAQISEDVIQNKNAKDYSGEEIKVAGLVRSARWKKNMVFAHIHDGTTYEPLQAILPIELATG